MSGLAEVLVKRSSFFQCLWIQENDDMQFRSCLVIGVDAIQIALHHPSGRAVVDDLYAARTSLMVVSSSRKT